MRSLNERNRCRNNDDPFRWFANFLYLFLIIKISGISSKKSIVEVVTKPRQVWAKIRHETANTLSKESDAGRRCLPEYMPTEELHLRGIGIDLNNIVTSARYLFLQTNRPIDHILYDRPLCGVVARDTAAR